MSDTAHPGQLGAADFTSDFNAIAFIVRMLTGTVATATLVKVNAVEVPVGITSPGVVTIQPLVNQIDAQGKATPHGEIFNIPYFRLQGGANAVIIDPSVGDIGIAIFASRDISAVKSTKAQSNPGSRRRFDMADGLYIGGFLNGTPVQYVQFTDTEILVNGKNIVVHASESYSEDVNGYGQRTTFTGGNTFHVDNYTTGATVTTTDHAWTPPDIPNP